MQPQTIDFNEYQRAAIGTETTPTELVTDRGIVEGILITAEEAGNLADLLKKHLFRGKDLDLRKIEDQAIDVREYADDLVAYDQKDADGVYVAHQVIPVDPRIAHGVIGVFTEASELIGALRKAIKTGEVDVVNLGEEIGDVMWYIAVLLDAAGLDLGTILKRNTAKLLMRQKLVQASGDLTARNVEAERGILEGTAA